MDINVDGITDKPNALQHLNILQACYFECQDKGTGVVGASKRYIEMEIHTTSLFALAAAGPEQILKVAQDLDDGTTSSKEQGADLNPYTMYVKYTRTSFNPPLFLNKPLTFHDCIQSVDIYPILSLSSTAQILPNDFLLSQIHADRVV